MDNNVYMIQIHDHIYLKVWKGYEKFVNSCIKGFTEQYSYDDLTRHYQTQVALYIAAFYGKILFIINFQKKINLFKVIWN